MNKLKGHLSDLKESSDAHFPQVDMILRVFMKRL